MCWYKGAGERERKKEYSFETPKLISCTMYTHTRRRRASHSMHKNVKQVVSRRVHTHTHTRIFEPFICGTQQSKQYSNLQRRRWRRRLRRRHRPWLCMHAERHKGDRSVKASKEITLHMQAFMHVGMIYVHTHYTYAYGVHNNSICIYWILFLDTSRLVSSHRIALLQFIHCWIHFKK